MRTLLIDGDVVAYRFAAAAERSTDWGEGVWTLHADEAATIFEVDDYIAGLVAKLKANAYRVALSDPSGNYFRRALMPDTYKADRAAVRKPLLLKTIKEHLAASHGGVWKPALEADDVMGVWSTHPRLIPGERIICSIDKDMRTIPGLLYADGKMDKPEMIGEAEADYFHMMQTLIGDQTDGYSGCPGVGPVRAKAILAHGPYWPRVVEAFKKAGLSEHEALTQARVARILRHTDYDFKKKEPRLWTPTNP